MSKVRVTVEWAFGKVKVTCSPRPSGFLWMPEGQGKSSRRGTIFWAVILEIKGLFRNAVCDFEMLDSGYSTLFRPWRATNDWLGRPSFSDEMLKGRW